VEENFLTEIKDQIAKIQTARDHIQTFQTPGRAALFHLSFFPYHCATHYVL